MRKTLRTLAIVILLAPLAQVGAQTSPPSTLEVASADRSRTLDEARWAFYNAHYQTAAAATLEPCAAGVDGPAACELRTAALLFQLKRALGEVKDKKKALKDCVSCPELLSAFEVARTQGQALARATLEENPDDPVALFLLGKLNLNYVWLHLGTLGRKTGWGEYREARRSLDEVLKDHPEHVRARVARGWIDYIVATKVPRGVRWLLGGGSKTRGLRAVREAAETEADFFTRAEARFALWDMQVRERNFPEAVVTARTLVRDFPQNRELSEFLEAHQNLALSLR